MENQGKSKHIGPEKQQFADRVGCNNAYEAGGGSGTKNLIGPDEGKLPHYIQSLADEYYAELGDDDYERKVAAVPKDLETHVEPAVFEVQPAAISEGQVPTKMRQVVRGPGINYTDRVYCPSINPMTTVQINVRHDLVPHIIDKHGSHSKHIRRVAQVSLHISREPKMMKTTTIAVGYREASMGAQMVVELIDIILQTVFNGNEALVLWASVDLLA